MSTPIYSASRNYKCTIGRSKDGTFSVTSIMAGDNHGLDDIGINCAEGFDSNAAARAYARAELAMLELDDDGEVAA